MSSPRSAIKASCFIVVIKHLLSNLKFTFWGLSVVPATKYTLTLHMQMDVCTSNRALDKHTHGNFFNMYTHIVSSLQRHAIGLRVKVCVVTSFKGRVSPYDQRKLPREGERDY